MQRTFKKSWLSLFTLLALMFNVGGITPAQAAETLTAPMSLAAPASGLNLCFTEYTGDDTTDFSSSDSQAVRDAVNAANAGAIVKIAGMCAGV